MSNFGTARFARKYTVPGLSVEPDLETGLVWHAPLQDDGSSNGRFTIRDVGHHGIAPSDGQPTKMLDVTDNSPVYVSFVNCDFKPRSSPTFEIGAKADLVFDKCYGLTPASITTREGRQGELTVVHLRDNVVLGNASSIHDLFTEGKRIVTYSGNFTSYVGGRIELGEGSN